MEATAKQQPVPDLHITQSTWTATDAHGGEVYKTEIHLTHYGAALLGDALAQAFGGGKRQASFTLTEPSGRVCLYEVVRR